MGVLVRPSSGQARPHRAMSICASGTGFTIDALDLTNRPSAAERPADWHRNLLTRFRRFLCLKIMGTHRIPAGAGSPPPPPRDALPSSHSEIRCRFGAPARVNEHGPSSNTPRRWPSWVLAVRSFPIGNPQRGASGLLAGNPCSRGAPDSLYLRIPVTSWSFVSSVQAGREPRSSAHD